MLNIINSEDPGIQFTQESSFMAYIKERLYEWAEWYSQCNFYHIGYSSRTIEDRLMAEGAIINSTAPRNFPQNLRAAEMEDYLNEMFQQEQMMAIVLRWHYFFPNDSYRIQSKKLESLGIGVSHMSIKTLVARGYAWLEGRMTSRSKYNNLWVRSHVDPKMDKFFRNMNRYIM
jgi:hypothetical protein